MDTSDSASAITHPAGVDATERSPFDEQAVASSRRRPGYLLAGGGGLVAAGIGLGVAEVLSGLSRRLQSPVLDVGDRFIDRTPAWLKDLAIDWFGTNDKVALLVGIGVLLGLYSVVVGVVGLRYKLGVGVAGAGLFGLVGAYAAVNARVGAPWWAALPSLAGAVVAALALVGLARAASQGGAVTPADAPAGGLWEGRRSFLGLTAAFAVAAAGLGIGGRWLRGRFSAADSRSSVVLANAAVSLPEPPTSIQVDVPGVSPFFTPNDEFYRIDTALTVPQVPAETWNLRVHGMVNNELNISFADLMERPQVESDITLTCVSNLVGGSLMGTARWSGIRLDDLLADAGMDPAATQIVGRSVDGYTCGFPVAALDGRDALVAVGMNGEPLPLQHGFPARLIVPGLYGYVSATKWLTELEITTFEDFDQYWVPRGWAAQAPIKTASRIDTPKGLATVDAGVIPIAGVAWAQTRGIDVVQLSIDGGEWFDADLADELNDVTWRQWSYAWTATAGRHTIRVRTIDATGAIQTADRSEPMPDGATGQHEIVVLVS